MMKKHLILLWCMLAALTVCAQKIKKGEKPVKRVIYDDDGNSNCLFNCMWNRGPLDVWMVDSCVNMQAGTQVTSYAICSGSDFFNYRSKYGRVLGEDLNGRLNCGDDTVAFRNFNMAYRNHMRLEAAGTDLIRESLTQARRKGMETILTLRMNDLHFNDLGMKHSIYFSEWWLEHPQYWTNDSTQGWHSAGALDFAHKEVRQRRLDYVREQMEKYGDITDVYLLDYMRFFCYFKSGEGPAHAREMTQMMRDIKSIVNEEAEKRNKRILLAVRVAPTLTDNMRNGLDIREWLREDLVDFISIGIHIVLDPDMHVDTFRKALGNDLDVPLYASSDIVTYTEVENLSEGMMRGFCSNMLAKGADGLQLFNYYFQDYNSKYHGEHVEEGGLVCRTQSPRLLKELGSLSTLEGRNKTYWLSDGKSQYLLTPNTPLPMNIEPGEKKEITMFVGDKMDRKKPQEVMMFIRTTNEGNFTMTLNGVKMKGFEPSYTTLYDKNRKLGENDREYAVIFPAKAVRHGVNSIRFMASPSSKPFTVRRSELTLKYGPVEQCGYF